MKIAIFGAAGFIGTNLTLNLLKNDDNELVLFDKTFETFPIHEGVGKIKLVEGNFSTPEDYEEFLDNQDCCTPGNFSGRLIFRRKSRW